jgi:hypothetical protein
MRNLFLALAFAGMTSCIAEQSYRLADADIVLPGFEQIPFPAENLTQHLSPEQEVAFQQQYGDGPFVIVEEQALPAGAPSMPLTIGQAQGGDTGGETLWDVDAIGEAVVGGLGTFFPSILPFSPALLLLFRRSRKHLVAAAKKALPRPGDTTIDLVGAATDVLRGFGMLHSTPASEFATEHSLVVEDEEEETEPEVS